MKWFGSIAIAVLISVTTISTTLAQMSDNCLFVMPDSLSPNSLHWNPDSVGMDTCNLSRTHDHWYSKRYNVDFKVNAFHLGYGRPDSILIVHWEDIDTVYSSLRNSFYLIYDKYGPYYFQKLRPQDTSVTLDNFKMIFNDYHLVLGYDNQVSYGGVLNDLDSLWTITGQIEAGFNPPRQPINYVQKNIEIDKDILLQPNPTSLTLTIKTNNRNMLREIVIIDISGNSVFEQKLASVSETTIDIRNLRSGKYIVLCNGLYQKALVIRK